MSNDTPEPGTRARVATDDGEEIAIYTGHMWASEDGSRLIESVKSWQEVSSEDRLEITGLPETLYEPPVGGHDEEE